MSLLFLVIFFLTKPFRPALASAITPSREKQDPRNLRGTTQNPMARRSAQNSMWHVDAINREEKRERERE